ncbi:MAG: DMT family transporter [Candidatus Devosia phytovorans]|uniref:DMT family transporter n=1 Tax=Candidatus Devosia phytovorans TaxID=3121372 RepID=A0AAJ5VW62_9HYPH|nr:DMT family transporter [Devosia sp.]WEK05290.1 MAG: DMT family transporter [Devosia sp.]
MTISQPANERACGADDELGSCRLGLILVSRVPAGLTVLAVSKPYPPGHMTLRDWALVILVGCLFGSSFLLIAIVLEEVSPLTIAAGRSLVAALACWTLLLLSRKALPRDRSTMLKLCLLGLFSYALPFVLMPISQRYVSTGIVAIINLLLPIATLAVSHAWPGGPRATRTMAIGAGIGLVGAVVLALPSLTGSEEGQLLGIALCLCGTLIFAISFNVTRSFAGTDPQVIMTFAMTGAALGALPAALLIDGLPSVANVSTWWAWVALGLFPTALNFQIMYWMLPRVGATNFATNTYISPIVALVLGWALLGETLQPIQALGMVIVVAGLLVMDGRLASWMRRARA